ncbi:MAG: hypothetical protein FWF44_10635 [Defluviitaleaceae bacterium]|nr:hypothetical protein [Defluviitaleaceae bacterium]
MTQQEKACEVLDQLFFQSYYNRVGVTMVFLREYAAKKWVGENERLQPDALIDEAEARVVSGELIRFVRGRSTIYKPPAKRKFIPPEQKQKNEQPGSSLATGPQLL